MPTTPNASRLFEQPGGGPIIVINVKGADAQIQGTGMVALRGTILDPQSLAPSGMEIIVQMLPIDADKFANTVHEAAKSKAWKFPGDAKFVRWQDDRSGD